jgi:DedD protein
VVQAAAPAKGAFSVQVGAFGSEATARKLVADLKADGMPAYIAPLSKSGKTLHRVRAGPVPDRAAADKLAARLKARGLPVSVVSGG